MNEKCYIHNIFLGDKVLVMGKKVMSMVYPRGGNFVLCRLMNIRLYESTLT